VLVLDVSEVGQLDAGGLEPCCSCVAGPRRKNAKVKLVNPPPFFRRMLEATHLNSVFEISSLKDAIAILRGRECPQRFAVA